MKMVFTRFMGISLIMFMVMIFVNYPPVFASAEGWRFITPFYGDFANPALVRNGIIYALAPAGYQIASINPNGTLSNWSVIFWSSGSLPYVYYSIATTSNLIYVVGGGTQLIDYPPGKRVGYVGFNPDGTLTNPVAQNSPTMQTGRELHSSLIINGRLYCFGGYSTNSPPYGPLSSVEFATINADSSVGPFQYTSSYSRISGAVYLAWNWGNNVYCLGTDPTQSTTYIETSFLQPDGTLSLWSTIGNTYPFAGPAVLTSRTTLFLIQNSVALGGNPAFKTMVNSITNNVNNWISAPHTLVTRSGGIIATWDRFVYWFGGWDNADTTVELYDPDLADTELFQDTNFIHSDRHRINLIQLEEGKLNE